MRGRGRVRGPLLLPGPAFVAAHLMAMLIQSLSSKVGLAAGRNLPEPSR